MVPWVLQSMEAITSEAAGKTLAFFLDYDGTLTPIVESPELAFMNGAMRDTVSMLADMCPVAVVSGRDREDVESLVQIGSIYYAGSHGFEISGPGGLQLQQGETFVAQLQSAATELRSAEAEVRNALQGMQGALVESKSYAFAVHFRLVEAHHQARLDGVVDDVASRHPQLRRMGGKKVYDFLPRLDWDKGKAVNWLLEALGLDGPEVLPFYLGDDLTDEDAFSALEHKGIGVLVTGTPAEQPTETKARYALRDVDEVREFLEQMIELLENSAR